MRKLLLFTLILTGLFAGARVPNSDNGCNAYYKYSVNDKIMTFAAATVLDFADRSEGNIVSWYWDFGDGNTSYEQSPTHIFNHPIMTDSSLQRPNPYRTVTLEILTFDSCRSSYSEVINIMNIYPTDTQDCKAGFYSYKTSYDSLGGTASFKFVNTSEGKNLSYYWKFEDGYSSNEAEPEITFKTDRPDRKVCLTVTGDDNCVNDYCEALQVFNPGVSPYPGDSGINYCFIDFAYSVNYDVQTFTPALVLNFYTKSEETILKYLWDFGDGTSSSEPSPTHIFNYPITDDSILSDPNPFREVCLTVTTVSGCETTFCQMINIYMITEPYEPQCYAWFKYYVPDDVITIPEVKPFKFLANSEYDIISWFWDFGDGTTSYEPEPMVTFDIFRYSQSVCLTILTADSCTSTWCEEVYISPWVIDTIVYPDPVCNYIFEYDSYYPPTASACIGTVTAKVVLGDQKIDTEYFYWSDGTEGPTINNLCPTNTYTLTALTVDGCKFSGSFVFNSNGTITEIPVDWWIYDYGDDSYIGYFVNDSNYYAEWIMCDGSVVTSDSISINKYNCPENKANLIIRDMEGNIVYNEMIDLKTTSKEEFAIGKMLLYPVPTNNILNIRLKNSVDPMIFEIYNMQGRVMLKQNFSNKNNGNQYSIDVSSLPMGTYLGKAISGKRTLSVGKFNK